MRIRTFVNAQNPGAPFRNRCDNLQMSDYNNGLRRWIVAIAKSMGLSVSALAEAAGITPSTLTRFVNDDTSSRSLSTLTMGKIRAIAARHGQALSEEADAHAEELTTNRAHGLMVASVATSPLGKMPVLRTASSGSDGFFELSLTDAPVEFVEVPPGLMGVGRDDVFAIRVQVDTMEPIWEAGDILFVIKSRPLRKGAFVLLLLEGSHHERPRAMIGQFLDRDEENLTLSQLAPSKKIVIPRSSVKSLWRVCHWRDLIER